MQVFADLHIHIGSAKGKPVKITAAKSLSLSNILEASAKEKGLNLIGLADGASPLVQDDFRILERCGLLSALKNGGYRYKDLVVFLGSEVELSCPTRGLAHFLAFFPNLEAIQSYTEIMSTRITNMNLSTQKATMEPDLWMETVTKFDGVVIAAHAFTPHKGVYGRCVSRLGEMFANPQAFAGLELGLSADSAMALKIQDTWGYPYLTNSDAHSIGKIAREYTVYDLKAVDFAEWVDILTNGSNGITANYGLHPLLGKYHRSFCPRCQLLAQGKKPVLRCENCKQEPIVGVWDRIADIASIDTTGKLPKKPPYFYQIPLEWVPGLGPKKRKLLLDAFGTEINVLHKAAKEEIAKVVGEDLAATLDLARQGKLTIIPGGGGIYGKVKTEKGG